MQDYQWRTRPFTPNRFFCLCLRRLLCRQARALLAKPTTMKAEEKSAYVLPSQRRSSLSMVPGAGMYAQPPHHPHLERKFSLPRLGGDTMQGGSHTPTSFPDCEDDTFVSGNVWDEQSVFSGKHSTCSSEAETPVGKHGVKASVDKEDPDASASEEDGEEPARYNETANSKPSLRNRAYQENVGATLTESIHGFSDMEDPFPEKKDPRRDFESSLGDFGFDDDASLDEDGILGQMHSSSVGTMKQSPSQFAMARMNQSMTCLSPVRKAKFLAPNFHASANIFYSHDMFEESESFADDGKDGEVEANETMENGSHDADDHESKPKKSSTKKKKKKSSSKAKAITEEEFARISKKRVDRMRKKKASLKPTPLTADEFARVGEKRLERILKKKDDGNQRKSRKAKKTSHNESEESSTTSGEKKSGRKHRHARRRSVDSIQPDNPLSAMVVEHFKKMQKHPNIGTDKHLQQHTERSKKVQAHSLCEQK